MNMTATVIRTNAHSLLVRNADNGDEVLVFYRGADRFSPGERIVITFNGQMTFSEPPQITAMSIERIHMPSPQPPPAMREMRAVVLQRGRGFLLVRNLMSRQNMRVEYEYANHFCPNQRVIIRYDTITLTNPPTVTATEITPDC